MSEENKTVARHLYQRFSAGDLDVVDEVISDDFVEYEEMPGLARNKAGVRQLFEMLINAFEGAKFEVDDMIAEGDKVFALVD
jgi:ketosteroid isomerase-like protein